MSTVIAVLTLELSIYWRMFPISSHLSMEYFRCIRYIIPYEIYNKIASSMKLQFVCPAGGDAMAPKK
jgi:hypothetical protein